MYGNLHMFLFQPENNTGKQAFRPIPHQVRSPDDTMHLPPGLEVGL